MSLYNPMITDSNGEVVQTWVPQGGKTVVTLTAYTITTIGARIIKLGEDSTIAMADTIAIQYYAGDTLGLIDGETYTFGTAQNIGLM